MQKPIYEDVINYLFDTTAKADAMRDIIAEDEEECISVEAKEYYSKA